VATVEGTVASQFAPVQEEFARADVGRGGAAFTAYLDGEKVVDLWVGDAQEGVPWAKDTLTTVMSATKGCAALCMQILCDRGLVDVDAPVARYWPEYAQAGKEQTLVRHVLNHTSGLLCFSDPGDLLDWAGNGWDDYDEIARRIAASPPAWEPGTRIGYHAISIGWLIQEIVRRVTGMTVGAFFAREVAERLNLSIFIGTPPEAQTRLADVMREQPDPSNPAIAAFVDVYRRALEQPGSRLAQAGVYMHGGTVTEQLGFLGLAQVRETEIPAANGSADARSLARMYAMLAQGGELDGVRIVSPGSVKLFGTKTFSGPSAVFPDRGLPEGMTAPHMAYALGYEGDFGETPKPWRFGPSPEAFGHLGAGGQVGFADPARHVAVGFVRNHLGMDWSVSNALIDRVYACL
jgi:CubicO group peptidase (beta-lactamase class C family)